MDIFSVIFVKTVELQRKVPERGGGEREEEEEDSDDVRVS